MTIHTFVPLYIYIYISNWKIYIYIMRQPLYRWKNRVTHNVRSRVYAWDFTIAYLWPTFLVAATLGAFSQFLVIFWLLFYRFVHWPIPFDNIGTWNCSTNDLRWYYDDGSSTRGFIILQFLVAFFFHTIRCLFYFIWWFRLMPVLSRFNFRTVAASIYLF